MRKKVFEVAGLPQSKISGFHFMDSSVSAASLGTMEFANDWTFENFVLDISNKIEEKAEGGIAEQERLK
jgi:hypothetical protein